MPLNIAAIRSLPHRRIHRALVIRLLAAVLATGVSISVTFDARAANIRGSNGDGYTAPNPYDDTPTWTSRLRDAQRRLFEDAIGQLSLSASLGVAGCAAEATWNIFAAGKANPWRGKRGFGFGLYTILPFISHYPMAGEEQRPKAVWGSRVRQAWSAIANASQWNVKAWPNTAWRKFNEILNDPIRSHAGWNLFGFSVSDRHTVHGSRRVGVSIPNLLGFGIGRDEDRGMVSVNIAVVPLLMVLSGAGLWSVMAAFLPTPMIGLSFSSKGLFAGWEGLRRTTDRVWVAKDKLNQRMKAGFGAGWQTWKAEAPAHHQSSSKIDQGRHLVSRLGRAIRAGGTKAWGARSHPAPSSVRRYSEAEGLSARRDPARATVRPAHVPLDLAIAGVR